MALQEIQATVQAIKHLTISEILFLYDIQTVYIEQSDSRKPDAYFLIQNDQKTIFLRSTLNERLIPFVLLHELGHFFLHGDKTSFSFKLKLHKTKLEKEANLFAVLYLLQDVELCDLDIPSYLMQNYDVPANIAQQCFELMR